MFLDGIADGIDNREDMNKWVSDYDEDGISKHISFDDKGESEEIPIWSYEVKNGQYVALKQLV